MSNRRKLRFHSEDEVIIEIARLRRGYAKTANWTLEQMSWHLVQPIDIYLSPPTDGITTRTPEQEQKKVGFVDAMLKTRTMPERGRVAPPAATPPDTASHADIERFIAGLRTLKAYPHPLVAMGPVGPVSIEELRDVHLVHAEHHLSFLDPHAPARREGLKYENEDACLADLARLRKGHVQSGNWNLQQICWHLAATLDARMKPSPHATANTPEQDARRPILLKTLADSQLPNGIVAPDPFVPPADAGDDSIERFAQLLKRYETFPGPTAPHRIFGILSEPDAHTLNLIHCANHLRYLTPV